MTTRKAYPPLQHACRLKRLIAEKVKGSPQGKLYHLSAYSTLFTGSTLDPAYLFRFSSADTVDKTIHSLAMEN